MADEAILLETDVLVVGAGPAGATTAMLLARMGIDTLMIARHRGVANSPRAHIVNQRAMEVLRDAGLEDVCIDAGSPGELLEHTFWLESMDGNELARAWTWGNAPHRRSDYLSASPCKVLDLPQTRMEPILVSEATRLGAHVRFGWELVDFEQDDAGVTAQVRDRLTGHVIAVHAKYMVGADGARSKVLGKLGIPLIGEHGLSGDIYNVHCRVDLSRFTLDRHASFYFVIQPECRWSPVAVLRMVRPWNEWLVSLLPAPDVPEGWAPSPDDFVARIRQSVGPAGADLPVTIISTSPWRVNDVHAEYLTKGRVHCIGDAIHRHPPAAALGSNTCLQDAFNLAWKLAYVIKGKAGAGLLDSFNAERQPVAAQIVKRANASMSDATAVAGTFLGSAFQTGELTGCYASPDGRQQVRQVLATQRFNGSAHGVEMTRNYASSAIIPDGTSAAAPVRDAELYYRPSSKPGSCLPHAWLARRTAGPLVSTLDIAGKDRFHLLTGHGGEAWRGAVDKLGQEMGLDIGLTMIGPGLDYEDPYYEWRDLREVDDSGCLLVRPDQIIAWRQMAMPDDPVASLRSCLREMLALNLGISNVLP